MRFATCDKADISRQRGFWLRSFLGKLSTVLMVWLAFYGVSRAQIEVPGPFHLSHLQGVVVNQSGMPIEHAEITLVQNEKIAYSTRTDAKGHFEFKGVTGRYSLRMHLPTYSIVSREVLVGFEILTALEGHRLYVILGPGACSDDCSSVFTSKREFNQALHRMTGHNR
jgi:hypothetical protein